MRPRLFITLVCAIVFMIIFPESRAHAQGIERESLSGPYAAEQLRQANDNQPYNLKLGPVTLRIDADAKVSYNDNINLDKTGRISDFIFTPMVTVHGQWKVSDLNTLTFNVGVGYQEYLSHSQNNNVLLAPDSEASFNFFIGDVAFNAHDTFSYQQDPTQIGQLSNTTRLSRFQNDVGIGATWDLDPIVLNLDYDHSNLWVTQSVYDYLTNQSDTIAPKVTYKVDQSINAGMEFSYSDVRYEKSFENNYMTISTGPFVTAQISDNLSLQGRFGGYFSEYERGGQNGDNEDVSSFYASGGVTHRINSAVTESLTAGREFLPGLTSNFTDRIYINYGSTWQATKQIYVSGNLWWENLTDSDATFREDSNRYGAGMHVEDNFAEHLTLTLDYQYILKNADPSFLSYYQNVGTLGVRYRF
jgi:hypothetical protein